MKNLSTYRQDNRRSGVVVASEALKNPEVAWHDKLTKHREHWSGSGHVYLLADYPMIFAADHYMHFLFSRDMTSGDQGIIRFADEEQLFTSTSPSSCPFLVWGESVFYCRDYKIYGYDKELHTIDFQVSKKKPQIRDLLTTSPIVFNDSLITAFSVGGEPEPILIVEISPGKKAATYSLGLGANDLNVPLACNSDSDSLYVCGIFDLAHFSLPLVSSSEPSWAFEYPHCSIAKTPVVSDESVFLGVRGYEPGKYVEEYVLVAVDKEDGKLMWDLPVGSSMSSLCVLSDEIIFHDGEVLTGCDLATGEKLFEIDLSPTCWYSDPLIL